MNGDVMYGKRQKGEKISMVKKIIRPDDICIIKESEFNSDPLKEWCRQFLKNHEEEPEQTTVPQSVPDQLKKLEKKRQKEMERWTNAF